MSDPLIGNLLDGYRVEKLLGEGGMARVYRAMDERLGRFVAIKVIEPTVQVDEQYRVRFEKEARAVAQLHHPNIVTIYRFGEVDGLYYMAMQFIDGADLSTILAQVRAKQELLAPQDALMILRQIANALDYAHAQGVIHRDIKPANLMIDHQDRAFVTDFGLALIRLEGTRGEIFGTPQYIAPEQAVNSAGAVAESDQYALGVILYEILTGALPFDGKSVMQIAMAHMTEPLPDPRVINPSLHPAFVPVLERALAKEPDQRYPSCAALIDDFQAAIARSSAPRSRITIAQEVQSIRDANPLPPLPAMRPTPLPLAPLPPVAPPPAPPTRATPATDPGSWRMVGIISAIVVLMGLIAIIGLLSNRGASDPTPSALIMTEAATETPTVTLTVTETIAPTVTASLTITPTPTIALTETPTATATLDLVSQWTIRLIARGDEVLYLVNESAPNTADFPLGPVVLMAQDRGGVTGSQWEVAALRSGECVRVDKGGRIDNPPITCNLTERIQVRQGNERFWKPEYQSFTLVYPNSSYVCSIVTVQGAGCVFNIPIPAAG
ncbi:MAG: protein kinase [Anaerolineae bacterium]|jgi:serine/threonine protein kinase|nr:protein kinase [Anaerolineae bacterium]